MIKPHPGPLIWVVLSYSMPSAVRSTGSRPTQVQWANTKLMPVIILGPAGFKHILGQPLERHPHQLAGDGLRLYAKGLTTSEISVHFAEIYGAAG